MRSSGITAALDRLRPGSSSTSASEPSKPHHRQQRQRRKMHLTALVPALLSIVAFVLSLLALTAGRTPSYLPQLYVLRVNTTSIATSVDLPTLFAQLGITNTTSTGIPRLDSAISTLSADGLGDLLNTAAHELGLHDIYTAHATTWCEGALTSSGTRVTGCTTPAIPFSFNPVAIIESELLHNLTLKDMGFDSADVDRVVSALETAYRSMSICYLLGVLTAALCIVGCVFAVWQPARALAACNATAAGLTVLFLGAAAAIATVVGTRVKDVVNEKAKVINVQAENSTTFLAVSWIAVAFAIAVFTWWSASCCCRRGGRSVDKEAGMEKWGARGEMEQRNRRDRRETEDFVGQRPVVAGHAYDGEGLLHDRSLEDTAYRGAGADEAGPYSSRPVDAPYADVDGPYDPHPQQRHSYMDPHAAPPPHSSYMDPHADIPDIPAVPAPYAAPRSERSESTYAPTSPTLTERAPSAYAPTTYAPTAYAPTSYAHTSPPHSPISPTRGYASPTRGYGSPVREPYTTRTLASRG